jgi:hypothetical protein
MKSVSSQAEYRKIRVKKEDAAYVYATFESYEGVTSYTTLPHEPGAAYRDMELMYSETQRDELQDILDQLGDIVYEINEESKS